MGVRRTAATMALVPACVDAWDATWLEAAALVAESTAAVCEACD